MRQIEMQRIQLCTAWVRGARTALVKCVIRIPAYSLQVATTVELRYSCTAYACWVSCCLIDVRPQLVFVLLYSYFARCGHKARNTAAIR